MNLETILDQLVQRQDQLDLILIQVGQTKIM